MVLQAPGATAYSNGSDLFPSLLAFPLAAIGASTDTGDNGGG